MATNYFLIFFACSVLGLPFLFGSFTKTSKIARAIRPIDPLIKNGVPTPLTVRFSGLISNCWCRKASNSHGPRSTPAIIPMSKKALNFPKSFPLYLRGNQVCS